MKGLFTLLAACLAFAGFGQVQSFSLLEAQQYAIEHSYSVLNNTMEYEKSKKVLQKIMGWTNYGIHICNVIHKTFEKDKATGHLGTFIQKKCETTIFLNTTDREKFNSPVQVTQRDSRAIPFDTFFFDINENGIPKECEEQLW